MGTVTDFERELMARSPATYGQWHSIDLHNHSPSSFDYQGDKSNAVEATADRILKTGLSIVMFTDHTRLPEPAFTSEVANGRNERFCAASN